MTFTTPEPWRGLSRSLRELAGLVPPLQSGQYQGGSKAAGTTAKVQTSGHGDVSSQWRPAVTSALDETNDFAEYLGKLLVDAKAVSEWTKDTTAALLIASRPRQARLLSEYRLADVAEDVSREARQLVGRAKSALQQDFRRSMPLPATCLGTVLVDTEDGDVIERTCGAALTAVFAGPRSSIFCADHPGAHRVSPDMWPTLIGDLRGPTFG